MVLTVVLPLTTGIVFSQSRDGRWAFGVRGGGNMWFGDFNKRSVTPGGELLLRYGLSRYVSMGLRAGYDEFILQQPLLTPYDYVKLRALPASMGLWLHFSHGEKFSPYLYIGGGVLVYQRKDVSGNFVPDSRLRSAVIAPLGLGFEFMTSERLSFALDLGFKFVDDNVDFVSSKSPDGLASAAFGVNLYFGRSDDDDDDRDGLTNGDERKYGTNPDIPDTDGDGLSDGDEVLKYNTDPLKPDTDGDGSTDGAEVLQYKTDPLKADTDGDGLSDGDEVLTYKSDPLNQDTDVDGLTDGEEVMTYKTDPSKVDTEVDGLTDGDEILHYKTDPLKADTDGDGLSDGDEVLRFRTDPLRIDTDNGTVNDSVEVARRTDPLNPNDDIIRMPEVGKKIVLEGVTFKTGSARLAPESKVILDQAYVTLVENPEVQVEIGGHTDTKGKRSTNLKLSLARANAVKTYLVGKGIAALRIRTKGYGPDKPVASNKTQEGRAKNRRIEFARIK